MARHYKANAGGPETKLAVLPAPASIWIANVAGLQAANDLAAWLERWHTTEMGHSQCPSVWCHQSLHQPGAMGCDRWVALIAVWHRLQRACLVVDVGTAMTVDALSAMGEFLGGIIVPGPDAMKQALAERAEHFPTPLSGGFQDFGQYRKCPVQRDDSGTGRRGGAYVQPAFRIWENK
ncbi:MAG: type III pantothenate kinase [Nitrosomonas sp.]|nr:type III pantothenate kinase [Nitrosomonas sp.]